MSEYTSVYLKKKTDPLRFFRKYPSSDEIVGKTEEEIRKIHDEVHAYNESVRESFGCLLFYLSTTPSRELDVLPRTEDSKPLTNDLLQRVIDFYNEEMMSFEIVMRDKKEDIERYEDRIVKATPELYDKIEDNISDCKCCIAKCQVEIDMLKELRSKFEFVQEMMETDSNSDRYELIYTSC